MKLISVLMIFLANAATDGGPKMVGTLNCKSPIQVVVTPKDGWLLNDKAPWSMKPDGDLIVADMVANGAMKNCQGPVTVTGFVCDKAKTTCLREKLVLN